MKGHDGAVTKMTSNAAGFKEGKRWPVHHINPSFVNCYCCMAVLMSFSSTVVQRARVGLEWLMRSVGLGHGAWCTAEHCVFHPTIQTMAGDLYFIQSQRPPLFDSVLLSLRPCWSRTSDCANWIFSWHSSAELSCLKSKRVVGFKWVKTCMFFCMECENDHLLFFY